MDPEYGGSTEGYGEGGQYRAKIEVPFRGKETIFFDGEREARIQKGWTGSSAHVQIAYSPEKAA